MYNTINLDILQIHFSINDIEENCIVFLHDITVQSNPVNTEAGVYAVFGTYQDGNQHVF